jgi:hypothetical protein
VVFCGCASCNWIWSKLVTTGVVVIFTSRKHIQKITTYVEGGCLDDFAILRKVEGIVSIVSNF